MHTEPVQRIKSAKEVIEGMSEMSIPQLEKTFRGDKDKQIAAGIFIGIIKSSMVAITMDNGDMVSPLTLIEMCGDLKRKSKIAPEKLSELTIEALKKAIHPNTKYVDEKYSIGFAVNLGDTISKIADTSDDDVIENILIGSIAYDSHEYMIGCLAERSDIVKEIDMSKLDINDDSLREYCMRLSRSVHSDCYSMCLVDNKDYLHFIFLNSELMLASTGDSEAMERLKKFKEKNKIVFDIAIMTLLYDNKDEIMKARQIMRDSIMEYVKDIMSSSSFEAIVYMFNRFRRNNPTRRDDIVVILAAVDVISPIFNKENIREMIKNIASDNDIFNFRKN